MKTYQSPELILHGSVGQLTGVTGTNTGTDVLIVNGSTVVEDDDRFSGLNGCSFFDSGGDGTYTFLGDGDEDACRDRLDDEGF